MRIGLRFRYFKLQNYLPMTPESPEPAQITGSLQVLIFLESMPYSITVGITVTLISLVLSHSTVQWDDIFMWRSLCFAIFSFLILSLANYGDRISNGRFYIFTMFLLISSAWTPLIIGASSIDTILVFSSCLQPLLIVREASRMCFLVQPLLVSRHVTGIRFFFFLLFLFANLGAFFFIIALTNLSKTHLLLTSLILQPVYLLLAAAAFKFGGNVVAHRNVVERGFKCLVNRFEQFLKRLFSPLCKCLNKQKTNDYRVMHDPEIVTCTECMVRLSTTLAPFILFFATVEMTFYTWVRDYDVMLDLGYAEWEITLMDIYHSFNIITALLVFVIILPLVQTLVPVHDGVLLCVAYFVLLLCWISTSSLQYANELQQTPYPKENQAEIVVFSNIETPTLIDSLWTKKQWLSSGDVEINKIKLSGFEALHSNTMYTNGTLYQNGTQNVSAVVDFQGTTVKTIVGTIVVPKQIRSIKLKSVANSTVCYLLTTENNKTLDLKIYDETLNRHFLDQTKSKPKIIGHLFTLCSKTLFYGPPYYLVIQHLRTRVMTTVLICKEEASITNLTVGWYTLFLRQNVSYVSFEMLIGIQKEALHYLYIEKASSNLSEYRGKVVNLVTPFFRMDKSYFLIPLGLFAVAFTLGIVSLHTFVLRASPRHLHEFAFAIMYTMWSVGGGIAGLSFRYFCAHSRGMFFWVFFVAVGLLLFVRNAVVFIKRPHPCSPDGWVLEDALRAQAMPEPTELESEEGDEKFTVQTPSSLADASMTDQNTTEPPEPPPKKSLTPRKKSSFKQSRLPWFQPKASSPKKSQNDTSPELMNTSLQPAKEPVSSDASTVASSPQPPDDEPKKSSADSNSKNRKPKRRKSRKKDRDYGSIKTSLQPAKDPVSSDASTAASSPRSTEDEPKKSAADSDSGNRKSKKRKSRKKDRDDG